MAFCSPTWVLLLLVHCMAFAQDMSEQSLTCPSPENAYSFIQTLPIARSAKRDLHLVKAMTQRSRSLHEIVSKAFFINLAQDSNRRESMEMQLTKLKEATGLPYERFNAVDATDRWIQELVKARGQTRFGRHMRSNLGLLGCYASHLRLWEQILAARTNSSSPSKDSLEFALVLEDDALVQPDAMDHLDVRLASVPKDVDILLLGAWGDSRPEDKVGEGCYKATSPFLDASNKYWYGGMHAYLIRLARLPVLIKHVKFRLQNEKNCKSPDGCTTFNAITCRKYALFPPLLHTKKELIRMEGRTGSQQRAQEQARAEKDRELSQRMTAREKELGFTNCCDALSWSKTGLSADIRPDCTLLWQPGQKYIAPRVSKSQHAIQKHTRLWSSNSAGFSPWRHAPKVGAALNATEGFNLCRFPVRVLLEDCQQACESLGVHCAGVEFANNNGGFADWNIRKYDGPLAASSHDSMLASTGSCLLNTCTPECHPSNGSAYNLDFYFKPGWTPVGSRWEGVFNVSKGSGSGPL